MTSSDAEAAAGSGPQSDPNDLMYSIEGMYRILDLVSETGSGGLGTAYVLALASCPPNHL